MTSIISLDPGYATGMAFGSFARELPLVLTAAQVMPYEDLISNRFFNKVPAGAMVVSEKFTLRDNDFRADLTPEKIEGMMEYTLGLDRVVWRDPSLKSQISDKLLKHIGWWKTGKDVDWEDGRDANDAIIHMLGHVAFTLQHRPTLEAYFR